MIVSTYISESSNPNGPKLYMDAFTSLSPQWSSTVTKYPVSDKSIINNNIVHQNPIVNLTCFTGSNPIKSFDDSLVGYEDLDQRVSNTHQVLLKWWQNKTQLYIFNEFITFDKYVITSYQPKQYETTSSMQFELTMEYFRPVSYERGTLITFMDASKTTDSTAKSNQSDSSSKENISNLSQKEKVLKTYGEQFGNLLNLIDKETTSGN